MAKKMNNPSTIPNSQVRPLIRNTAIKSKDKSPPLNANVDANNDAVLEAESFEGFLIDILDRLSEDLDFEYAIKPNSRGYGMLDRTSGNWSGLIGQLVERV